MRPSLGEVQAVATRAARGAGLAWGLAEEAGWAARWGWTHGLDSLSALAEVLADYEPAFCPLLRGAAFCDAPAPFDGTMRGAVLFLPFLACAEWTLVWEGGAAEGGGGAIRLTGALPGPGRVGVILQAGGSGQGRLLRREEARREAPRAAWALLKRLEGRTFAPPSEASRAGAGAGLADND